MYKRQIYQIAESNRKIDSVAKIESNRIETFFPELERSTSNTTRTQTGAAEQWRIQTVYQGEGGIHGERAKREPITGVWGQSPQRGPGAEPLVGVRGAKPL